MSNYLMWFKWNQYSKCIFNVNCAGGMNTLNVEHKIFSTADAVYSLVCTCLSVNISSNILLFVWEINPPAGR